MWTKRWPCFEISIDGLTIADWLEFNGYPKEAKSGLSIRYSMLFEASRVAKYYNMPPENLFALPRSVQAQMMAYYQAENMLGLVNTRQMELEARHVPSQG